MNRHTRTVGLVVFVSFAVCGLAHAGGLTIDWHAIGGGATQSTGDRLVLSGTIGQHYPNDPGAPMSGGDLRLIGGFWAVAVPTCGCLSDVNNDGGRDGLDVQGFVDCLTAVGTNCACADVDGVSGVDLNDVSVFVNDLITGATCP